MKLWLFRASRRISIFSSQKIDRAIAVIVLEWSGDGLLCLHFMPGRYTDGRGRSLVSAAVRDFVATHVLETWSNERPRAHIPMLLLTPNEN